jgi:hypothetical protein
MKKSMLSLLAIMTAMTTAVAQVGIGTSNPSQAAQLEVNSTTKGFLPPRMTAAQRDAIAYPPAGLILWCNNCGSGLGELQVFDGRNWTNTMGGPTASVFTCGNSVTFTYRGASVTYGTVTGAGGSCWFDRNLGASRVPSSMNDSEGYGDLFQWGRGDDGHQAKTSGTTATLSTSDNPGNALFIVASGTAFYDWRNPQNNNLWQGMSGINNPCPTGWRLPTKEEWEAEVATWSPSNSTGAFSSPLKLTVTGFRDISGPIWGGGMSGHYWSSTVPPPDINSTVSYLLEIWDGTNSNNTSPSRRATGNAVRCRRN